MSKHILVLDMGRFIHVTDLQIARQTWEENIKGRESRVDNWGLHIKDETFEYEYPDTEIAYMKDGVAEVTFITDKKVIYLHKGDFVLFFKGEKVKWRAITPFNKDYVFDTLVE